MVSASDKRRAGRATGGRCDASRSGATRPLATYTDMLCQQLLVQHCHNICCSIMHSFMWNVCAGGATCSGCSALCALSRSLRCRARSRPGHSMRRVVRAANSDALRNDVATTTLTYQLLMSFPCHPPLTPLPLAGSTNAPRRTPAGTPRHIHHASSLRRSGDAARAHTSLWRAARDATNGCYSGQRRRGEPPTCRRTALEATGSPGAQGSARSVVLI